MAEERDGRDAFDYFMENVNSFLADQHFREVLRELYERRKDERRREMEKHPAPETSNQFERPPLSFDAIETLVRQGKSVVSSDDSLTIEWALNAIREGRTATLYVSQSVLQAILKRYWTPERIEFAELRPISAEQAAKVKSDFNIEIDGYANSVECPRCAHLYSTYEFIQQGIQEHGEEVVRSAFSFKGGILQINPNQVIVCPTCRLNLIKKSYNYSYNDNAGRPAYACGIA